MVNQEKTIKNIQDLPFVMKAEDIAAVLDISKHSAYELMKVKGFPVFKAGRLKRVNRDLFVKWIEEQKEGY